MIVTRTNESPIVPPSSSSKKVKKQHSLCLVEMALTEYSSGSYLFTLSNFFDESECQTFIEWSETIGFERFDHASTRYTAERHQERFSYQDDGVISSSIFSRVQATLPTSIDGLVPVGCSKNIRMYKYSEGDSFGKHVDESQVDKETGSTSKLTLLIYLNDTESSNLLGGKTIFYKAHSSKEPLYSIEPKRGMLLLHGHGHRCLTHEGELVMKGFKYVLRTDVLYSPPTTTTAPAAKTKSIIRMKK